MQRFKFENLNYEKDYFKKYSLILPSKNIFMKKVIIWTLIVLIIVAVTIFYMRINETAKYKNKGNILIERIESYRQRHGELPDNVKELGIEEEMGEGPYYEKIDSVKYIVYFNIGFDNAFIYYSDTQKWEWTP